MVRIVEVREIAVRFDRAIANAVVDFSRHTVSLVALITDQVRNGQAVAGVAFNSIGRFAQSGLLRERMIPRLLAADAEDYGDGQGRIDPARVAAVAMRDEKPGGHGDRAAAVGALELAAWDLRARLAGEPAWHAIAQAFGCEPLRDVHVYAAGGYYHPEDGLGRLCSELAGYRQAGFTHAKIKIGGTDWASDAARIEAAIAELGSGANLAVDANGRFARDQAIAVGSKIEPYGLRWYEEPGDPLDYALMADLAGRYGGPLATGENLLSRQDVVNLLRHGGMRARLDVFQMDAGLSYGLTEYAAMIAALEAAGHRREQALPHGGHLINLHIVAGLGLGGCEAYPGVFQPFGGYLPDLPVEDGRIGLPQHPGFGLERKPGLAPHIAQLLA
ncbi:L-alanine-DL-glutamate epimerase-like enolase superfamily enzyme [Novosphingobium kunmingense]|uniref:L-alanine-DL-glutamate epimerase-like enolase superfamily enzyme n=1 Tax=Novosphingobium kunmingense TaxID=1211806 RepID=A0A2N0H3C1_9SPHN|nr:enolase C-terminal domain-like protein [Novosphingobium kunmingense]PKB13431.1 L-alanine-DL-glutamate epimerase-like enolase superfamily enzyme [Novosphingobium kunmingense]